MASPARNSERRYLLTLIVIVCIASISAGYSAIQLWPDIGGQAADLLRNLFGDQVVASLETTIFQAQDRVNSVTYRVGAVPPTAPWEAAPTTINAQVSPAKTPIHSLTHDQPSTDA